MPGVSALMSLVRASVEEAEDLYRKFDPNTLNETITRHTALTEDYDKLDTDVENGVYGELTNEQEELFEGLMENFKSSLDNVYDKFQPYLAPTQGARRRKSHKTHKTRKGGKKSKKTRKTRKNRK